MENLTHALLMAAGILLALLTIFIALYLFRAGAGVTNAYQNSNERNELNIFNNNFNKMLTGNGDKDTITIYDVITAANFAWNNNCKYVDNPLSTEYNSDPRMLRINICTYSGGTIIENLQNYNQQAYDIILKAGNFKNGTLLPENIYYKIDIAGYSSVGRINKVNFSSKKDAIVDSQISGALSANSVIGNNKYLRK